MSNSEQSIIDDEHIQAKDPAGCYIGSSNQGITKTRKPTQCSVCHEVGHNARKCPQRLPAADGEPLPAITKTKNIRKKLAPLKRADYEDEAQEDDFDVPDGSSVGSNSSSSEDEIDYDSMPELWETDSEKDEDPDERPVGAPGPGFKPFQMLPEGIGLAEDWSEVEEDDIGAVFNCFFTPEMIDKFVTATNNFAVVTRVKGWTPMTVDEFYAFLGIVLHLGIVTFPTRDHVWDPSVTGSKFVRSVMAKARFEVILRAWHYTDYSALTPEELKAVKAEDPFW
eukprot:gene32454-43360_t